MRSVEAPQHETLTAVRNTELRLLSPELAAVAACVRNGSAPTSGLNWDGIQRLAVVHGVAPIVHQAWRNVPEAPPALLQDFKHLRQVYALRGVLGLQQRDEILRIFQEAQVPYLVLKGAALARTWYGDLSLRPFVDIDVLLPPPELARAHHLLLQAGYAAGSQPRTPYHEAPLQGTGLPCSVELHHSLSAQPLRAGLTFDDLYARSLVLPGEGVRTLGREDTLLHLCLHLLGHVKLTQGWKLSYLLDIKRHLEAFAIDWESFAQRTRETGTSRGCGAVLGAAALVVNAAVPPKQIDGAAAWELLRYPVPDLLDVSHHFLAAFLAALTRADFGQAANIFLRAMIEADERHLGVRSLRPHLMILYGAKLLHETIREPRYVQHQLRTWLPRAEDLAEREQMIAGLFGQNDA